jgi:hypothetical protein
MNYCLLILFGVHGDESIYTQHVANSIKKVVDTGILPYNIKKSYILGPYSKWSTRYGQHFDRRLQDPNRLHPKTWDCYSIDLITLLKAKEIFYSATKNKSFSVRKFLKDCEKNSIKLNSVVNYTQTIFKDFLGYIDETSWQEASAQREKLIKNIRRLVSKDPNSRYLMLDIHAGIGEPDSINLIHYTNHKIVEDHHCYLVDGLARDINDLNIEYYIIEAGIKGSTLNFKYVLQSFANRFIHQKNFDRVYLFNSNELKEWRKKIGSDMKYHLESILSTIIKQP